MTKKKKKGRISTKSAWMLTLAYFVVGFVVSILFLNSVDPTTEAGADPNTGLPGSPWLLFPIVVIIWPVFLVIMIWRALT